MAVLGFHTYLLLDFNFSKNENNLINKKQEDEEVEYNVLNFQSYINSTHTRENFHVVSLSLSVIELQHT